jgi:hypothetical protein
MTKSRPWKDHFKSDFRSDQDHLLQKGSKIESRSYLKNNDLDLDLDLKSRSNIIFCPTSPLLRVKISKRTKSRL